MVAIVQDFSSGHKIPITNTYRVPTLHLYELKYRYKYPLQISPLQSYRKKVNCTLKAEQIVRTATQREDIKAAISVLKHL